MKINACIKPIQSIRISRQDAAPTVDIEMWEWLSATNNWHDLLFLRWILIVLIAVSRIRGNDSAIKFVGLSIERDRVQTAISLLRSPPA